MHHPPHRIADSHRAGSLQLVQAVHKLRPVGLSPSWSCYRLNSQSAAERRTMCEVFTTKVWRCGWTAHEAVRPAPSTRNHPEEEDSDALCRALGVRSRRVWLRKTARGRPLLSAFDVPGCFAISAQSARGCSSVRPVPSADDLAQDRTRGLPAAHRCVPMSGLRIARQGRVGGRAAAPAVSVVDATKAPATAPPTHAALRLEAAF
jgi:hypothetical protein